MTTHIVGISDMYVSSDPEDTLVTYSLGSCVGLTLYDPTVHVGGMIHCMLPLSKIDLAKAGSMPCMFVDTGVPLLLQTVFERGATRKNLIAKVAGASSLLDEKKLFNIGERNYTILRKILWRNNILINSEDVGGQVARSVFLEIATGETRLKIAGEERPL